MTPIFYRPTVGEVLSYRDYLNQTWVMIPVRVIKVWDTACVVKGLPDGSRPFLVSFSQLYK